MEVFFLLDLAGTAVFAYTGSVAARKQQFHVLGIFYIAVLTAVGGGTIRSVLLKTPELFWMQSSEYLIVVTMTVLGSYFIRINTNRLWFYLLDSQSLAVFVALGVSTTLNQGQPLHIAFAMGVLSGIGGGLIRDAITSQPPQALSDRAYPVMMLAAALGSIVAVQIGLEAWTLACLAVLVVVSVTAAIHYYQSGNLLRYNHWQADRSQQTNNKTNHHPANNSEQRSGDNRPTATGDLQYTPVREQRFNTGQTQPRSTHGKSGRMTLLHAFSVITLAGVAGFYYFNQSISHATSGPSISGGPKSASPTPAPDFADEKIMYLATLTSINNAIDKQDPIAVAQHLDTAKRNRFADARLEVLISKSDDLNSFNSFLDNAAVAYSNNQPDQLEAYLARASDLGFYNPRLDALQNNLNGIKERRAMELANKNLAADRVNLHVAKAEHELNVGNLKLAKRELDAANSLGAVDESFEKIKHRISAALEFEATPLIATDFEFADKQFLKLEQAIKLKNLKALSSLTADNPDRRNLFENLFERYVSINTSVTALSTVQNEKSISATLKLENMRLPDGNIAVPPDSYGEINLAIEKTSQGWSRIQW